MSPAAAQQRPSGTVGMVTLTEMYRLYFATFSTSELDGECRLARHPLTRPTVLAAMWERAEGLEVFARHRLCLALCANESLPAGILEGLTNELVGDGTGLSPMRVEALRERLGDLAFVEMLRHPAVGWRGLELWEHTGGRRIHILANPAADPDLLHERYTDAPELVAANPAATAFTIDEITDRYTGARMRALAHPACPRHLIHAALKSPRPSERARAYRNPNVSVGLLELGRELAQAGPYSETVQTLCARLGVERPTDWRDETVAGLVGVEWDGTAAPRFRTEVATALISLDDDARAAATALVRGGFGGTVAELFDVAATFDLGGPNHMGRGAAARTVA